MYEENVIYIIGNGFDKHHRLNTGYDNYKSFLKSINPLLALNCFHSNRLIASSSCIL